MKVLVTGGRDYQDGARLSAELHAINRVTTITMMIDGAARGADQLAHVWACMNDIESVRYPADWAAFGKMAGSIRNQQMLDEEHPDIVVAFPGNDGTRDMVMRAVQAGIEVRHIA